jgi:ATP-dependent exoDNAse (exonuclease V) beta subunit
MTEAAPGGHFHRTRATPSWRLRASASEPSLTTKAITSLARTRAYPKETASKDQATDSAQPDPAPVDPEVQVLVGARPYEKRPGGPRFRALVHAMLASIDLDADAKAVQASAAVHGRMFDATEEEIQAAIITVGVALQHTILRRATASRGKGNIRRETPVLLRLDDDCIAEGVLDLAFREQTSDFDGSTVVDFKTDQEFSTATSRYIAQVTLYARAVQAATDLPARGIILVV